MPKRNEGPPPSSSPTNTAATARSGSDDGPEPAPSSARERLDAILERDRRRDAAELALKRRLVPRLAKRAYHLEEGNTWCQDWIQYQRNTHPVFGLCLYHPLHPVRLPQRVVVLVGSIGEFRNSSRAVDVCAARRAYGACTRSKHKKTRRADENDPDPFPYSEQRVLRRRRQRSASPSPTASTSASSPPNAPGTP